MRAEHNSTVTKLVGFLPLLLGCTGLFLSAAYEAQRSGIFLRSFYSIDRFIQYHLDGIAGLASLTALLGIAAGLVISRIRGQSRIVTCGTVFSVLILLWSMFGLSL